jgi:septum formation protein
LDGTTLEKLEMSEQNHFFPEIPLITKAEIVLASGSPRRQELLGRIVPPGKFSVFPVDLDESRLGDESPAIYVERLAVAKAQAGAKRWRDNPNFTNQPTLVIGSDTTVALGTRIYGKPSDPEDAANMLRDLSGRTHQVITGLALALLSGDGKIIETKSTINTSQVTFRKLSESEIAWYVATGESTDKAGAYAIQGYGGVFISSINGDYSNIVGLPLGTLVDLLRTLI